MERSGMAVVTMRQLLEAGVHFGHQTRRWNPKMKRFIFGERNGIYIIDLNQTLQRLDVSYSFVRDMVANNGSVLFIGTKKQSQDPISRSALSCGMPFVNERWLGGMLTNFSTIALRVKKMQEYERMRSAGDFEAMPKKEALILTRELEKLERNLGGIRDMATLPDAVFIIDIKKEHIAVSEANKMGIPIVAVVDTNCDPDLVQFPIPGNDDAIRSGTLMCHVIAEAVQEGRFIASRRGTIVAAASTAGPIARAFEPARVEPVRPAPPVPAPPAQAGPVPSQPEPAGAPQSVGAAPAAPSPPPDGPADGLIGGVAPAPAPQGGVAGGAGAPEPFGTSPAEEAGSSAAHEASQARATNTTSEAPGSPADEADLPSNVVAEVAATPDN
jgi:small subunit ribosomal protein S2